HRVVQGAIRGRLERDVAVDELPGDAGSEYPVELGQELLLVAGKVTAVYFRGRRLRHDIHFVAGPQNCRIYRIVQRCADNARERTYFAEQLTRVVRGKFGVKCP